MKTNDQNENAFVDDYKSVFQKLRKRVSSECPSSEMISSYSLGHLSRKQQRHIENHLELCPQCFSEFSIVEDSKNKETGTSLNVKDWETVENSLDKAFYSNIKSRVSSAGSLQDSEAQKTLIGSFKKGWQRWKDDKFNFRKWTYGLSFCGLIVFGVYSYAYFQRPDTLKFASLQPVKIRTIRGESITLSHFNQGLNLFDNQRFDKAINQFQLHIDENPNHYEANYYAGISLLMRAEIRLPGLVFKYRIKKVKNGISYLQRALSQTGENPFYREDCHWFLGKAWLMLDKPDQAIIHFNEIIKLNRSDPSRENEAQEIIKQFIKE